MSKYVRNIIIGDVHGCIDEFESLLRKVQYNPEFDRVILLGDLVDRGPDSLAVLRKARELNLECVKGNHEDKFVKWYKHKKNHGQEYYHNLNDKDIQYILNMPLYIELDNLIIVHAGIKPNVPLAQQTADDLMYLRYTDKNRKFISLKAINKYGKEALGAMFWTEFGPFDKNIVYGHNVGSFESPKIDHFENGIACYGIDTGCCFGGNLTALIWETKDIVQVQAKKTYYKSTFEVR